MPWLSAYTLCIIALLRITPCSGRILPFLSTISSSLASNRSPSRYKPSKRKREETHPSTRPIRVAFQGVAGAYSEKSLRELLGEQVIAIGYPNFEACYRAVASNEVDYACLPIENSLGGSIHENYDLMLRYDLTIVAEHDFRVEHCLLAREGVELDDIKYAMSHPQALAQCDNYFRSRGIIPIPKYDTAGAAKMLSEGKGLMEDCTPENTAAVASDLAGRTYGLKCVVEGIEDDDSNFTRFLLLARKGVSQFIPKNVPAKTSIVFTFTNTAGALYKALACFSLRDIDISKIESRPTSASLLSYLKFRSTQQQQEPQQHHSKKSQLFTDIPRFRYCFYLDFLASELDENAQNALHHLREQADFCRILGSYPSQSKIVGPVAMQVENSKTFTPEDLAALQNDYQQEITRSTLEEDEHALNIGIVGFGHFGQFLANKFIQTNHKVSCIDTFDKSNEAEALEVEFYNTFDIISFLKELDVVIVSVPLLEFEQTIDSLPLQHLTDKLIVEVCPLSSHPKSVLLNKLHPTSDILCANCLFGPNTIPTTTAKQGLWEGLPILYEKVRILDHKRLNAFLSIFEKERCQMVEMSSEQSDEIVADAEFITHLTGRLLERQALPYAPVASREYRALLDVAQMTSKDTFDLFYGLYQFNPNSRDCLTKMRESLARVERQLAAKEAYFAAKADMQRGERKQLIEECRALFRDVLKGEGAGHDFSKKAVPWFGDSVLSAERRIVDKKKKKKKHLEQIAKDMDMEQQKLDEEGDKVSGLDDLNKSDIFSEVIIPEGKAEEKKKEDNVDNQG